MNLYNEIKRMLQSGIKPVIEFTKFVEDLDTGVEVGMRGIVEQAYITDEDCFLAHINLKDYFEYNQKFMTHTWLNKETGEYDATSLEGGWYPKNHMVEIYDSFETQDEYNFYIIKNENSLYEEYIHKKLNGENNNISYIKWLENEVKNLRGVNT